MNASKLFTILGLGASFVALAYPEAPTNHAADSTASIVAPAVEPLVVDPVTNVSPALITEVVYQASEVETLRAKIAEQAAEINDLREQIRRLMVAHPPTPVQEPKPAQTPTKPTQAQVQQDGKQQQYVSYASNGGGRRRLFGGGRFGGGRCGLFGCR